MTDDKTSKDAAPHSRGVVGHAQHGPRNEVNWEGGSGRQPYANQGDEEGLAPFHDDEVSEGDRGVRSGRNLDQLEEVKKKP